MSTSAYKTTLTASPLLCTGRMLDTIPPRGDPIALAFSVRKTSTAYRGSAMRVRRSADGREKDIGFVQSDLDLAALLTFCNGFDGFVSIWYDQSGRGRNATQSTWTLQPQIVSRGKVITDTDGNQPTLRFNGGFLTTAWEPTAAETSSGTGIQVVAAAGLVTKNIDGQVSSVTQQSGILRSFARDLGTPTGVVTDYPNPSLPLNHDKLLYEAHRLGQTGNVMLYTENGSYQEVRFDGPDANVVTKTTLGIPIVGGPPTLSVTTVQPQTFNVAQVTQTTGQYSGGPLLYATAENAKSSIDFSDTIRLTREATPNQYNMVQWTLPTLAPKVPFSVSFEYYWSGTGGDGWAVQTFFDTEATLGTSVASASSQQVGYRLAMNLKEYKTSFFYSFADGNGSLDTKQNTSNEFIQANRWYTVQLTFDGTATWTYVIADKLTSAVFLTRTLTDAKALGRMSSALNQNKVRIVGASGATGGLQDIRAVQITTSGGFYSPLLSSDATAQYRHSVRGGNGKLYAIPFGAKYVLETDEYQSNVLTRCVAIGGDLDTALGSNVEGKWWGGVVTGNTIYGIPYNAGQILKIDTSGSPAVVTTFGTFSSNQRSWRRGVAVPSGGPNPNAGYVYGIPYDAQTILEIKPDGSTRQIGINTSPEISMSGTAKFQDGVYANGRIYCPPSSAGTVLVIDTLSTPATASLQGSTGMCMGIGTGPSALLISQKTFGGRGYTGNSVTLTIAPPTDSTGITAQARGIVETTTIVKQIDLLTTTVTGNVPYSGLTFTGGSGYTSRPTISFAGIQGTGTAATGDNTYWTKKPAAIANMESDGNGAYKVGSITVTDGGDGFFSSKTPPNVVFTGGKGTTATARVFVVSGKVVSIQVPKELSGSGYVDASQIQVVLEGGVGSGARAVVDSISALTPVPNSGSPPALDGGSILTVRITAGGQGYLSTKLPTVRFLGGKGVDVQATAVMAADGKISGLTLPSGSNGTGYTKETSASFTYSAWLANKAAFAITIAPPSATPGGNPKGYIDGADPQACAVIANVDTNGAITEIKMLSTGSGYIAAPTVTIKPPISGTQAGTPTPTFELDGRLVGIAIDNPGAKYTTPGTVTVPPRSTGSVGPEARVFMSLEGQVAGDTYRYMYTPFAAGWSTRGASKFVGAYANNGGIVFGLPDNSHRVLRIDTTSFPPTLSDVFLASNVDYGTVGNKFCVGVATADNKILYGVPRNINRVLRFDMETVQGQYLSKTFVGNWSHGVLSTWNGVIYCVPGTSNSLLLIDTKQDSKSDLKYFNNVSGKGDKWAHAIRGNSGMIYGMPSDVNAVLEVNPGIPLREKSLPATGVVLADKERIVFTPTRTAVYWYDNSTKTMESIAIPGTGNVSYSDGTLLQNGNVVFAPVFNITDPFAFRGNVGIFNPNSVPPTFTYGAAITDVAYAAPYPSRSCVAFGNVAAWVPWQSTAGMVTFDSSTPGAAPVPNNLTGIPGTSRLDSSIGWASARSVKSKAIVALDGQTSVATYSVPNRRGDTTCGVVARNGTIFCIPNDASTTIQIIWPSNPSYTFPSESTPRTVMYLPSKLLTATNLFGGALLASDDRIYCIPRNHPSVLAIDTGAFTVEEIGDFSEYALTSSKSDDPDQPLLWSGGVNGTNGKIYCVPDCADHILVIDPKDPNPLTRTRFMAGAISDVMPGLPMNKWQGGVLARNGKIYCVPHSATAVLIIDPETDTWTIPTIGPLSGLGDGPYKWYNGVLAPNGRIYCGPYSSSSILVIVPENDTAYTIDTKSGADYKWGTGALAANGLIYYSPFNISSVLELDPATDTLRPFGTFDRYSFLSFVAAPNGRLYGMPNDQKIIELVPNRNYIGIYDYQNAGKWTAGTTIGPEFRLRPHAMADNETVIFHGGGAYGLYNANAATQDTALVTGPALRDGISTVMTRPDGSSQLVSVESSNVSLVSPYYGGVAGVKSFSGNADLYAMANASNFDVAVGNAISTSRYVFKTIYIDGGMGVLGGLASNAQIVSSLRDVALSTTPYGWNGAVGGTVSIGMVKGTRYDTIGAPEFTSVLNGECSEVVFFSSDQTARLSSLGESQSFYFLDTKNLGLTPNTSTSVASVAF